MHKIILKKYNKVENKNYLIGIIGALCVQGNAIVDAACAGVLLHALAGDDAAAQGQRGTLAGDLMPYIRKWANTTSP